MTQTELQRKIEEKLPGAQVQVQDLTGTADHWQVTVIAPQFMGKSMIEQHRLVKAFFEADIQSGVVHALSLKTFTPAEWEKRR